MRWRTVGWCDLFEVEIATDKAYWLVHPPESAERPKVAAFRAWLLARRTDSNSQLER